MVTKSDVTLTDGTTPAYVNLMVHLPTEDHNTIPYHDLLSLGHFEDRIVIVPMKNAQTYEYGPEVLPPSNTFIMSVHGVVLQIQLSNVYTVTRIIS